MDINQLYMVVRYAWIIQLSHLVLPILLIIHLALNQDDSFGCAIFSKNFQDIINNCNFSNNTISVNLMFSNVKGTALHIDNNRENSNCNIYNCLFNRNNFHKLRKLFNWRHSLFQKVYWQ